MSVCPSLSSEVGTADAEINIPSVGNPELTSVLDVQPRAGQNIALHALPTASNFFLVPGSTFPVQSPAFSLSNTLPAF